MPVKARAAAIVAPMMLAAALVIVSCRSFREGRALVEETARITDAAATVRWDDDGRLPTAADLRSLDALGERVAMFDRWNAEEAPVQYRLGANVADRIREPTRDAYLAILGAAFVVRVKLGLEAELRAAVTKGTDTPADDDVAFARLETYLVACNADEPRGRERSAALADAWGRALGVSSTKELGALRARVRDVMSAAEGHGGALWTCDDAVTAAVRARLALWSPLDRVYRGIVRPANLDVAPITRASIFGGGAFASYVTSKSNPERVVDGAYTTAGWQRHVRRGLVADRRAALARQRWVLGEPDALSGLDHTERETAYLRERYFNDFTRAWAAFLKDLVARTPASDDEAIAEWTALATEPMPYRDLFRIIDDNARLDEDPLGDPRWISPPERALQPLVRFGVAPGGVGDGALVRYRESVASAARYLAMVRDGSEDRRHVPELLASAVRATDELVAPSQSGFTRPLLMPLLEDPLALTRGARKKALERTSEGRWESQVCDAWQSKLEDTYPFAATWKDARLDDYTEFLRPDGILLGFFARDPASASARARLSGPLLSCYVRGREIAAATFADGAEVPQVIFEFNLHTAGEGVAAATLDVDGARRAYARAPGAWLTVTWPGKGAESSQSASLTIRGDDGSDDEIVRPGAWGIFRLFDAATQLEAGTERGVAGAPPTVVATWRSRAGGVVKLDVRAPKNDKILAAYVAKGRRVFTPYACPTELSR
jgi:type VI secretion system protein ImpL